MADREFDLEKGFERAAELFETLETVEKTLAILAETGVQIPKDKASQEALAKELVLRMNGICF